MQTTAERKTDRIELADRVTALHDAGFTYSAIASMLGLSRSYVTTLGNDPTGEKDRARKRRYGGVCLGCGATTDGSNGRAKAPAFCSSCSAERNHRDRYWTRTRIIAVFREFYVVVGRAPTSTDDIGLYPSQAKTLSPSRRRELHLVRALAPRLPSNEAVRREFGSWPEAVRAAGFVPSERGTRSHREPRKTRPRKDGS